MLKPDEYTRPAFLYAFLAWGILAILMGCGGLLPIITNGRVDIIRFEERWFAVFGAVYFVVTGARMVIRALGARRIQRDSALAAGART